MDYRQTLIKMIDKFTVRAVEEFKEIELKIYGESRSIFKKNKDYEGNIKKLRRCKTNAQKIDPKSVKVSEDDKQAKGLMDTFQKCLVIFSGVCDAYIQFETALMNKANGEEKVSYSDIKNFRDKMRLGRENLNKNLDELNIWYAEFNDMERAKEEDIEDLGGVAFMTYEDLMSSDGEEK